jgi:uncharacterized secreted protein with C-terminal beta-propeller domain
MKATKPELTRSEPLEGAMISERAVQDMIAREFVEDFDKYYLGMNKDDKDSDDNEDDEEVDEDDLEEQRKQRSMSCADMLKTVHRRYENALKRQRMQLENVDKAVQRRLENYLHAHRREIEEREMEKTKIYVQLLEARSRLQNLGY